MTATSGKTMYHAWDHTAILDRPRWSQRAPAFISAPSPTCAHSYYAWARGRAGRSTEGRRGPTHVRRDRLMLASPIVAFPKIWLYVYSAWQLTGLPGRGGIQRVSARG